MRPAANGRPFRHTMSNSNMTMTATTAAIIQGE
jgi:hypothetical protein